MRTSKKLALAVMFLGTVAGVASAQSPTQTADQTRPQAGNSTASPVTTVDQAIDRVIAREHDEVATIRRYNPIIETYVQDMKPDDKMGAVPVRDHYFLGQADLCQGRRRQFDARRKKKGKSDSSTRLLTWAAASPRHTFPKASCR